MTCVGGYLVRAEVDATLPSLLPQSTYARIGAAKPVPFTIRS